MRCVARPVLVVADRQENLRLLRARQTDRRVGAEAVGVDAGPVLDRVAVLLEPPHHRVFGVEQEARGSSLPRVVDRPVVAHLDGASRTLGVVVHGARVADRSAAVEAATAPPVVRLPRRVGRLEQQVRRVVVVADDERNVARGATLTRCSFAMKIPEGTLHVRLSTTRSPTSCRSRPDPVAGIGEASRLRDTARQAQNLADLACAVAAVIAEAIDVRCCSARSGSRP